MESNKLLQPLSFHFDWFKAFSISVDTGMVHIFLNKFVKYLTKNLENNLWEH